MACAVNRKWLGDAEHDAWGLGLVLTVTTAEDLLQSVGGWCSTATQSHLEDSAEGVGDSLCCWSKTQRSSRCRLPSPAISP